MPASDVTIAMLRPDDLLLMDQLLDAFSGAFEDPENYSSARPAASYMQKLLASDTFIALVAMEGGSVIGGLAAYELKKFEQARSEIYIYDLAVAEAARRKGVATALIQALKPIAAARGAEVIYVQADLGDGPAIALYTKLGLREDVLHFDIAVK
jgi:aminoglycoside 3-N-acetyltransferase I